MTGKKNNNTQQQNKDVNRDDCWQKKPPFTLQVKKDEI